MSKKVDLVRQRTVSCPSCDAKTGDPCNNFTGDAYKTKRFHAVKYNHVLRIRKYSREMAEWNRAQTDALLRKTDGN